LDWAAPKRLAGSWPRIHRLLENKYYIDELYNVIAIRPLLWFSRVMWWIDANVIDGIVNGTRHLTVVAFGYGSSLFDRYIVDGAVNGVANSARGGSQMLRRVQNGF